MTPSALMRTTTALLLAASLGGCASQQIDHYRNEKPVLDSLSMEKYTESAGGL